MADRTAPAAYSGLQKALHWGMAALVLAMLPVGVYMVERGISTKFDALTNTLYTWHKTIGFVLLCLVVWRILVRRSRGVPAPEASLTPFQRTVSEAVHRALYGLLVLVPLLGWAGVSAYPARGILFGLSLPPILPVNEALAKTLLMLHGYGAMALAAFAAAHIGAGLMHAVVLRDGVMRRMLP